MRASYILLIGALAVSAAGVLLYPRSAAVPQTADTEPEIIISEKPMDGFLSLQEPVNEHKQLFVPAHAAVAPEAEPAELAQVPVQSIEERGDAMLFEADALSTMPFDQAITMPFD